MSGAREGSGYDLQALRCDARERQQHLPVVHREAWVEPTRVAPLPHEGRVFFLCGVRWALVQRCCSHLRFAGRTGEKRTETAPALYETLSIILLLAIGLLRPERF